MFGHAKGRQFCYFDLIELNTTKLTTHLTTFLVFGSTVPIFLSLDCFSCDLDGVYPTKNPHNIFCIHFF